MEPLIFNLITVLELIAAEFISVWFLSKKKHGFMLCLATYILITLPIIVFMLVIATKDPDFGNGNGKFMILGLLYFIPALVNYGGDWKHRIIVAFYSFSYGLAGFVIAVRTAYLFSPQYLYLSAFIAQTVIFALTLYPFIKLSRGTVIKYFEKAEPTQKNILILYTITSFLLIIMFNNTLVNPTEWKRLLIYLLLIFFIILTYRLMVTYLKTDEDKQRLNELTTKDGLTRLANRNALKTRIGELLKSNENFYVTFIDLDKFKTINDIYGHNAGDMYLRNFADALSSLRGGGG